MGKQFTADAGNVIRIKCQPDFKPGFQQGAGHFIKMQGFDHKNSIAVHFPVRRDRFWQQVNPKRRCCCDPDLAGFRFTQVLCDMA